MSLVEMNQVKLTASGLKPILKFMEDSSSESKSMDDDSIKRKIEEDKSNSFQSSYRQKLANVEAKRKQSRDMDVEDSLSQEILELRKRLHEQFLVRYALERALTNRPISLSAANEKSVPKDAMEVIKDIAVLELEVVYLEHYLLSMYRKTFERRHSSSVIREERSEQIPKAHNDIALENESFDFHSSQRVSSKDSLVDPTKECNDIWRKDKFFDCGIHRNHSSLSQPSAWLGVASSSREFLAKAVDSSYHSLPLSMLEQSKMANSNPISLAELLGASMPDRILQTPNSISEEMIRTISAIYCKLADPPLFSHDSPSSSFNSHFDNPLQAGESKELIRPYRALVKVNAICRESHKFKDIDIEHMLDKFRSLVYRLEEVDPRKMEREEKLAFWINIHNALTMHAFLLYGTPRNNMKTSSLLIKAAYNVGGHVISIEMIQSSILGCRMPRQGQWLRLLFSSKTKHKAREAMRSYAIQQSEPRLHFALCSGSNSDPAVRIYRPKTVFLELETAKQEYIASTIRTNKDHKILLPKIVESYVKDSGLRLSGFGESIEQFMPGSWREMRIQNWKSIEWLPHDFCFQYLLSTELVC